MNFKNIFPLLVAGGLFLISCNDNQKASVEMPPNQEAIEQKSTINKGFLPGSWKDQSKSTMDFSLYADGSAQSDNMETLLYQEWYVKDNQLHLVAKSIGNGTSFIDTAIYEIQKLDESEMILKQRERIVAYKKININEKKVPGQKVEVVKGEIVLGHEARVFKPCGSDKEFWVTDKTGKLGMLYNELTKGKKPYTPIFAEIKIIDKGKSKEGFPAQYDAVYDIVGVLETRVLSSKDCK